MPTKTFRWRIFPAAFFGGIGLICIVFACFVVLLMFYTACTGRPLPVHGPQGFSSAGVVISSWALIGGAGFVALAFQLIRGRWMWAMISFALCFAWYESLERIVP